MTFNVKIIRDSVNQYDNRLITFQIRYPRFIHSEVMTHREFSRNASSSRAIPVNKIIATIQDDPVYPSFWGKNQPGMSANEELSQNEIIIARDIWERAMKSAISYAEEMVKLGVHKQITNRILEPYSHISVILSSTNWNNFFALRRHKDAQPEIKILADKMYEIMKLSNPTLLERGQWHLPYVTQDDWNICNDISVLKKVSTARCGRVSYLNHEGKVPTIDEDIKLYERLVVRTNDDPIHASPAEHQATPDYMKEDGWNQPWLQGNFTGYIQHRKTIKGEYII